MLTSQQQLEKICDSILDPKNFSGNVWFKERSNDCFKSVRYKTKITGVEACVRVYINPKNKNKAVAEFELGSINDDCFSKEINFSIWKNNFHNDFFHRLALDELDVHIKNICSKREEREKKASILNSKIEAFQESLPFRLSSDNVLDCTLENNDCFHSYRIINTECKRPTLQISADSETLLKICTYIGKDIISQ